MDKLKLKPGIKFYNGRYPAEKTTGFYEEIVDCFEDGNYAAAEFTDDNEHPFYAILKWQDDHWQVVDATVSDDYWEMKANGRI